MQVHAKPISIAEARRRILATVSDAARDARAALQVDLADAAGYVLAEEILADRDAPPFNRAMMDGYALNSADFAARSPGFGYRVVGETIFAGTMPIEIVTPGGCRRIMTGAPLPPGADCVIPVEDALAESLAGALEDFVEKSAEKSAPGEYARAEPGSVSFPGVTDPAAIREHRFVAPRGGDLRAGQSVLKAGAPLDGAAMNVLASLGRARVSVRPPPRVVMLSTGDEIVPVESPEIRPEQIRDSNYYALCAGLAAYRVERPAHRIVPDDRDILTAAVAAALDADLLILSGGVSMGDADFVPGVLQAAGIETIFHRVNVKPGKPLWFGRGEDGRGPVVFGLPGNPIAVQVGWKIFIEEWVRAWLGLGKVASWSLPLTETRNKRGERPEFFPARLLAGDWEGPRIEPLPIHSSGHVAATLGSSGFALHPGDRATVTAGERVEFYPHGRLD